MVEIRDPEELTEMECKKCGLVAAPWQFRGELCIDCWIEQHLKEREKEVTINEPRSSKGN